MLWRSAVILSLVSSYSILAVCRSTVARSGQRFSEIARAKGIEYLVGSIPVEQFAGLVKAVGTQQDNSGGQRIINELGGKTGRRTLSISLLPLWARDHGRWASNLIRNGDYISEGVRATGTFDWEIGLIFPVSVLDDGFFQFNCMKRDGEDFSDKLEEAMRQDNCNSRDTDASHRIKFFFPTAVSLHKVQLLWIPQPLLRWIQESNEEFLSLPWDLPSGYFYGREPYGATVTQIYSPRPDGGPRERAPIPLPRADEGFDAQARVGNWYTVVPDWSEVMRQLHEAHPAMKQLEHAKK